MSKIHSDTILPERPSGLSQILSISSFPLFLVILRRWAFDWPLVAEMLCGISRLLHFHFSGPCVLNSFHLDICPQCTQGRDLNSKSTTMLSFKPSWEGQTAWHAPVLVHLRCLQIKNINKKNALQSIGPWLSFLDNFGWKLILFELNNIQWICQP